MPLALMLFHDGFTDFAFSPFIVPVAGCIMIAAIARGITPPPTVEELALSHNRPMPNAIRRRANIRLAGIILVSGAVAVALFFVILWAVIGERNILSGVACALIPFGIGAGFLIDTFIQTREIEDSTQPPNTLS